MKAILSFVHKFCSSVYVCSICLLTWNSDKKWMVIVKIILYIYSWLDIIDIHKQIIWAIFECTKLHTVATFWLCRVFFRQINKKNVTCWWAGFWLLTVLAINMGQDCQREIELLQPLIGKYIILRLKHCKKYDGVLWTRRLPRLFAHEYLRLIYPYNLQPKRMVCCLSPNLLEFHLYSDVCTFLVSIMHTQISNCIKTVLDRPS